MKIRMLGTGHGECKIKKKSVMDYRRSGGVLIDDKILIDAPADIFAVAEDLGFSDLFDKVTDVVISHSHPGHFSNETISVLSKNPIRIYATGKVLDLIPDSENITKVKLSTSAPVDIDGYLLYSLPANHATDIKGETALNFVIARDKALLYTLDGGGMHFSSWKILKELKIDAVIAECALELSGSCFASTYHNNFSAVTALRDILVSGKISDEGVRFVLSHIPTDRKRSIHNELSEAARAVGMSVAYDGYFFTI